MEMHVDFQTYSRFSRKNANNQSSTGVKVVPLAVRRVQNNFSKKYCSLAALQLKNYRPCYMENRLQNTRVLEVNF